MTRMTGPDCVVMCNLINTYIHCCHYAQSSRVHRGGAYHWVVNAASTLIRSVNHGKFVVFVILTYFDQWVRIME